MIVQTVPLQNKANATLHQIEIQNDLTPNPPSLGAATGDQILWTGDLQFAIQFLTPFGGITLQATPNTDGSFTVGPLAVTLDPGPTYGSCPYSVAGSSAVRRTGRANLEDSGDGIIIVDCSSCGDH